MKKHSEIIPRLYRKMLPIQIVLVVIGGINAIIDNVFAANMLGSGAMAVTGLFSPVSNFLIAVNMLFFGGAQVLCGRYLGKHMADRTNGIFTLDVTVTFMVSLVLTALCELIPGPIGTALGASEQQTAELSLYIRGFAIGLPFYCLGSQLTAFLQLEHLEKLTYASAASLFLSNVLLNWLFVGVLKMGLFGLGLATSAGNILFFVIQAFPFFGKKSTIRFLPGRIRWGELKDIVMNGLPAATSQACIFLRGILLNHLIAKYVGPNGLAALSAVVSFNAIYWHVPAGVTSTVTVLGSVYAGEEDRAGLETLMMTFLRNGVVLVWMVSIVYALTCGPVTRIFYQDPNDPVYAMTMRGFLVYPLFAPFSTFVVGFANYYHCLLQERFVRIIAVMDGIVSVGLCALILIPSFGMDGVWATQILGNVINELIVVLYVIIKNGKPIRSIRDMMLFPDDFGIPDEDRIDISIHDIGEVTSISQAVWNFCDAHGVDKFKRYCASLCLEEMAGNIVQHGFTKDRKKHSVDIRVSYVRDELRLNIKDDCVPFNPVEVSKLFDPDDRTHNLGLRVTAGVTKEMSYQSTFGLNILSLTI